MSKRQRRLKRRSDALAKGALVFFLSVPGAAHALPSSADLDAAFSRYQWDETAEMAHEILAAHPEDAGAKIKGAYALFQRGFTNAALNLLRRLSPADWKTLPQGQDRFVEIVTLFQKKVPMSVLPGRLEATSLDRVSAYLRDEIRYAKGRAALDRRELAAARELFSAISRNSRFYSQARYHLATIAIRGLDYDRAASELSRIFEPHVLSQTSEFWKDMSTQVSSHWGSSVRVLLDTEPLFKERELGELALIGFARIAYARKQYDQAISYYDRVPADSKSRARANLEKIWALLQLERNDDAQKAAQSLSGDEAHFESIEARMVRSLILVDSQRTADARDEIARFFEVYEKAKEGLSRYLRYKTPESLPAFVQSDLKDEARVGQHREYQAALRDEIKALGEQDARLFPVYRRLAVELDPLSGESTKAIETITIATVNRRLVDLERLAAQARLILAETWLEDREKLRAEYREVRSPTEKQQRAHDERLVELISSAVKEVDEALSKMKKRLPHLELRQAELLWELSTAKAILAQSQGKKADEDGSDDLRKRSLALAEKVSASFPQFDKRPDALFFTGFAALELGKTDQGLRALEKYLASYARDFHTPDALRIVGDSRFDRNDFAGAIAHYRRILEFPESPIIGYALYKIGWSAFNQRNYAQAVLALEKAIGWADRSAQAEGSLNLSRESKHDLISIYAEIGDMKKALPYFKMVFGDGAIPSMVELAKELDRNGQFEKSAEIYKTLIATAPSSPENLAFQTAVVRGAYKLRRWPQVDTEFRELTDRYRDQLKSPAAEGTPAWSAELILRETALAQHFEFKKSSSKEDAARIQSLDRAYLAALDAWPQAQEVRYELALYLLFTGRNADAAQELKTHWTKYATTLKEPVREAALRNLLYTLEKVEAKRDTKGTGAADAMSDSGSDILEYSTVYAKEYPATKFTRPIAGLRAAILFKYERIDEGITDSQKLLDSGASDEVGKQAFRNLRLAYYKKKDWKATAEWATRMESRADLQGFASELASIRGEASFLHAESIDDNGAAATEYLKIADDPKLSFLKDRALYNAFVRLDKAGRKAEAVEVSGRLSKASPGFKDLKQAAGVRAALFLEAADYERALPLLRDFVRQHDPEIAADVVQQARLNAGLISEALGRHEAAAAFLKEYLKAPDAPGKDAARRALTRIESRGRAAASAPEGWEKLTRARAELEAQPLPRGKDLAARLQQGGAKLESLAKSFLQIATSTATPQRYAFEAYCSVPFLYSAYARGMSKLGERVPAEARAELASVAAPIAAKAEELGKECLKRSAEAEHDGPLYRRANETWGWKADAVKARQVSQLVSQLEAKAPWVEPVAVDGDEQAIVALHLKGQASPDSWYALGRARLIAKKPGLARLTFIDALQKAPESSRLLNALAVIEAAEKEPQGLVPQLTRAAKLGSAEASVNLALYHLKAGRLAAGTTALREALERDAFRNDPALTSAVKEVTAP